MSASITTIRIQKNATGWIATFRDAPTMPNGIPLPLPFTTSASAEMVRTDLRRRFRDATIITAANSRDAVASNAHVAEPFRAILNSFAR